MVDESRYQLDKNRIESLLSYDIKYATEESEMNDLIKLVSSISERPISLLTFIDEKTAWIKAKVGFNDNQFPIPCNIILKENDIHQITDTKVDSKFTDDPIVTSLGLRFYAGCPLKSREGYTIGAICIYDYKPGDLTNTQRTSLRIIADQVMRILEYNKKMKQLEIFHERAICTTKAKEEFFSNMSHELRTPLNAIYGFTQILSKSQLDCEQRENVTIIKSSVENLISIINDILDISKLECGKLKIEKYVFDIRYAINNIKNLLSENSKSKNLIMNFHVDSNIPKILIGDKVRLNQILINLIGNALKFTEEGNIDINVAFVEETEKEIELQFSIKDTGIGIPADKLEKIFERFEQAQVNNCKRFGGSGLGLSITKSLIELQNGTLKVKSVEGKGSEFYFNIKYAKSEHLKILIEDSKNYSLQFAKMRALIVDDTPLNLKLIRKIIESWNMKVETAENGIEAIEKLKHSTYDVILMDLQMPQVDGFEAANIIRKNLKLSTPIVAMTANNSVIERRKCIDLGINEYITKPFKHEELYTILIKLLSIDKKYKKDSKVFKLHTFNSIFLELENNKPRLDVRMSIKEPINTKKSYQQLRKCKSTKLPPIGSERYENINMLKLKEYSGGDTELEKELVESFLKDIPIEVSKMEEYVLNNSVDEVRKVAHKMKSSMACFGLNRLYNLLIEIEKGCKQNDLNVICKLFPIVKDKIKNNLVELRQLLDK